MKDQLIKNGWIYVINFWTLLHFIGAIKNSSRRLLSFGYAAGYFAVVLVVGFVAMFFFVPARGTVGDVNAALDYLGNAVQVVAPIAAVIGASRPARRVKARAA